LIFLFGILFIDLLFKINTANSSASIILKFLIYFLLFINLI